MLTSNSAEDTGGAVTLSGPPAQLNLIRSVVSGNSAGSAGGGVWVLGDLHATNSTITNNLAMTNGGAVATNATLVFSTIVDNSTTSPSGGRQLGAVNLDSFAGYVAGGAGAPNSCSVERATSHGYNVGDDPSCGFGSGVGDLSDGPRDGVGLLGYYQETFRSVRRCLHGRRCPTVCWWIACLPRRASHMSKRTARGAADQAIAGATWARSSCRSGLTCP